MKGECKYFQMNENRGMSDYQVSSYSMAHISLSNRKKMKKRTNLKTAERMNNERKSRHTGV
jgi:hypothetical protein